MYDFKTGKGRSDEFVDVNDKFSYYDYLCQITYLNFAHYIQGGDLQFTINVDTADNNYKAIIHLALKTVIFSKNSKIYLPAKNWLAFVKFVWKEFGAKSFHYFRYAGAFAKPRGDVKVDPLDLIAFELHANRVENVNIFSDIYDSYFAKGATVYDI